MVIVLTDAQALAAVAAGDEEAFALLWTRFGPAVLTVVQRVVRSAHEAEDVTQEVFTTVWRRAAAFDPGRGDAGAWIHAIARNRALDAVRRRRGDATVDAVPEPADPATPVDERVAAELDAFRLHRAVAALPAELRACVELAYGEGLSQTEVAERLGWPLGTVKTRTRRALAELAAMLSPDGEEVER